MVKFLERVVEGHEWYEVDGVLYALIYNDENQGIETGRLMDCEGYASTFDEMPAYRDIYKKIQSFKKLVGLKFVVELDEMLMNPPTGSVDLKSNWLAEGYSEKDGLIPVIKDSDGDWIEA